MSGWAKHLLLMILTAVALGAENMAAQVAASLIAAARYSAGHNS